MGYGWREAGCGRRCGVDGNCGGSSALRRRRGAAALRSRGHVEALFGQDAVVALDLAVVTWGVGVDLLVV